MTLKLLLGTQNKGKLAEFREIFDGLPLQLLTLGDVGLGDMDVEETGTTFEENARLKAAAYAKAAGVLALADDSGLCVDALDGGPGIYSARYGGLGASNADKRAKLLSELEGVADDQRSAHFACTIVVYDPETDESYVAHGRSEGRIALTESDGERGFGYDPVFIPTGCDVTFADIPQEEKHRLSHRGNAARNIRPMLEQLAKERG